jgi:hypothetical protein
MLVSSMPCSRSSAAPIVLVVELLACVTLLRREQLLAALAELWLS